MWGDIIEQNEITSVARNTVPPTNVSMMEHVFSVALLSAGVTSNSSILSFTFT